MKKKNKRITECPYCHLLETLIGTGCPAIHESGYMCTMDKDHKEDHSACGEVSVVNDISGGLRGEHPIMTWPRREDE